MKNIILITLLTMAFFGCENGPLQTYEEFICQCDCSEIQECHDNAQLVGTYFYINPSDLM